MLKKYKDNLRDNLEYVGFSEKLLNRADTVCKAALKHFNIDASKNEVNLFISNTGKLTDSNQPAEEYASYVYNVGSAWIHAKSILIEIRNFSNNKIFDLDRLPCSVIFYERRKFWRTSFNKSGNLDLNSFSELNLEFQCDVGQPAPFGGELRAFGKTNIEFLVEFMSCFELKT